MTKPVLVYVGHSYHRKTNSTKFLIDVLRRDYEVTIVWDESWQPGAPHISAAEINILKPEIVLFFQTLIKTKDLRQILCQRLLYVPMHDHVVGNPRYGWDKYRASGIRSLNFCRNTHQFFKTLGYDSIVVQYWPEPKLSAIRNVDGLSVFFWPRRREVGWSVVKRLLGETRPDRIVLRAAPDPGEAPDMPSADDIREYRIDVVTGWLEKDDYVDLLSSCNVFIAPRIYEGIGQSFLEAMSLGLAVIAPDLPTMNEYIQHGVSGWLYPHAAPTAIDFTNITAIRERSLQSVANGHRQWLEQETVILKYLGNTPETKPTLTWRLKSMLNV